MKRIIQIVTLIFLTIQVFGQDCYIERKELLQNDFSNIWIGKTYQGTIGDNNQRIEIRFVSVSKINDTTYSVTGKSKVKSNICDFSGKLLIQNSMELDNKRMECEGPDYSSGFLSGKYELNENETQSHVGLFLGDFKSMYDITSNGFVVYSGWYGQEGVSEFIGEWNDCLYNDIMFLKRDVIDILIANQINKFILIGENVLNFHYSDDSYYQEWFEEIEDGWIVGLNFRPHVYQEFKEGRIFNYIQFTLPDKELNWRKFNPSTLFKQIDGSIPKKLY